jgi:hypothetical protein
MQLQLKFQFILTYTKAAMDNKNFIPLFSILSLAAILVGSRAWQGWFLGGSLSKLCPTALPSIQDGCCY